jgi:hypothetical protein
MTKLDKVKIMMARYKRLESSVKNFKAPGVKRKLARQIRNLALKDA